MLMFSLSVLSRSRKKAEMTKAAAMHSHSTRLLRRQKRSALSSLRMALTSHQIHIEAFQTFVPLLDAEDGAVLPCQRLHQCRDLHFGVDIPMGGVRNAV